MNRDVCVWVVEANPPVHTKYLTQSSLLIPPSVPKFDLVSPLTWMNA